MNYEVLKQIAKNLENILSSKHGPFYAGLIALTSFSFGYILIDNKYGISDGKRTVQPQLSEPQKCYANEFQKEDDRTGLGCM